MARKNRAAKTIVDSGQIDTLVQNSKSYRFFQALRLLELSCDVDASQNVRVRPSLNLAFPGNDIDSIQKIENGKYLITANFFGLYGVSSPLPTFYTEDLINERLEGETSMRDFLDIIHAKYYPLLYRAWKKNRLWLSTEESKEDRKKAINYLLSFVGLSHHDDDSDDVTAKNLSLIAFAGLFCHYPRSIAGLQSLVSGLLNGVDVDVVPCVATMVDIPKEAYCLLGEQAHVLGENSVLGDRVKQRSLRFDVVVGPLTNEQFQAYLPHKKKFIFLLQSIKYYCSKHYSFRVRFLIYRQERDSLGLGVGWNSLGVNTWIDGESEMNNAGVDEVQCPQYHLVSMGGG